MKAWLKCNSKTISVEKNASVSSISLVPVPNNPVLAKRSVVLGLPMVEVYEGLSGASKSQVIWKWVQK